MQSLFPFLPEPDNWRTMNGSSEPTRGQATGLPLQDFWVMAL